ncbi:MAG: glycosyltransferase [Phycisphaerales bacterium]
MPPAPQKPNTPTIALAHDWLVARRGGELVLDALTTHLLNTDHSISNLYTMFDSGTPITPAIDALTKRTSSLNHLPKPLRRWLLPRYPKAVEQLSQKLAADHATKPIDLLISTSSAAIKALTPPPSIPHICYCHAPARYLWSQTDQYTTQPGLKSKLRAFGLDHFGDRLRDWDQRTAYSVTQFIANSHFIAQQIKHTYGRDALVIHPPVRTDIFTPDDSISRTDHLLYVGALEPYKRVDLAIEAALLLGRPITILGSGSQLPSLKNTYKNNPKVTFQGFVPDADIVHHFRSSATLIQPQVEDFGITAVEAQATGLPVVARRAGGALDTIIETKTGTLFDLPTPQDLAAAIERLPSVGTLSQNCRANALRFSYEVFNQKIDAVIRSALQS